MHEDVQRRPAFEVLTIVGDAVASIVEAGAGQIGELVAGGDMHAPAFQYAAVLDGAEEAKRTGEPKQCRDPRLSRSGDPVPGSARKADAGKLALDVGDRARRVGDEDQLAALVAPPDQPIARPGIKRDAVMDAAPDVAQDEAVSRVEIVPDHSVPIPAQAR